MGKYNDMIKNTAYIYASGDYPLFACDPKELERIGHIGLVKALDSYDPDCGVDFSTYARAFIAGEMHRYTRDVKYDENVPAFRRKYPLLQEPGSTGEIIIGNNMTQNGRERIKGLTDAGYSLVGWVSSDLMPVKLKHCIKKSVLKNFGKECKDVRD